MRTASSVDGIPIHLTEERLAHIADEHPELAEKAALILDVLGKPDCVVQGRSGELSAVRKLRSGRRLAVVYRQGKTEGFVITAFYLKTGYYLRRKQVWP